MYRIHRHSADSYSVFTFNMLAFLKCAVVPSFPILISSIKLLFYDDGRRKRNVSNFHGLNIFSGIC